MNGVENEERTQVLHAVKKEVSVCLNSGSSRGLRISVVNFWI